MQLGYNIFPKSIYLHSVADVSKLEAILVEQVKSENINIHQSRATTQDVVYRLPIAHCELVVVNMFAPTIRPHPITDAPLTMVCVYRVVSVRSVTLCVCSVTVCVCVVSLCVCSGVCACVHVYVWCVLCVFVLCRAI